MDIGDVIRKARKEYGLTMKELANLIGVSEATISRWESGDIDNMGRKAIAKLSQVLNISPAIIMGLEAPRKEMSPDLKEILEKGEVWFNGVEYSLSKENGKMLARMIKAALEEDK